MANPNIKLYAAKGGRNSARRKLTVAKLDQLLQPLQSPQDAKERLERIQRWVIEGLIAPTAGNTAVRSVEIWLRAEAYEQDRHRIKALEEQIVVLEQALANARASSLKVV